jgi:phage tail sheath gpL-like
MSTINRWILTEDSNGISPTGFTAGDAPTMLRKCSSLMAACAAGGRASNLQIALAPVAAQATITFSGNCHNTYTLTVGNVEITFVTSGAAGASNQVNIGSAGTGADVAARVAALINGSTSTSGFTTKSTSWVGICSAAVSGAVLTLTASIPGTIGNGLSLSKTDVDVALTHLWGASVAGSEGTAYTYKSGL